MKKRIAFVAHLSEISGSGVALLETVLALGADYEVYLVLPGRGPLADRAIANGISPVVISNPEVAITEVGLARKLTIAVDRLKYVTGLRQFFRAKHIDLVYVNTSAGLFPALAAKLAGIPIAWHIHETLDGDDRRTRLKKRIIRRWADGLIYASKSSLESFRPPADTPTLIARNYIRIAELAQLRSTRIGPKEASAHTPCMIVMNGTIARKGADVLLRAVRILRGAAPDLDVRITIAGMPPAEPAFASLLHELGEAPELQGRVHYAGLGDSLAPLLEGAGVFVSPARNEALPIAIVEAMAAGVPVIATRVGDCADLLEDGRCGWVVAPEDTGALAGAIAEALTRPDVAASKADAAYAKVMAAYGDDDFWKPLKIFLNGVMGEAK